MSVLLLLAACGGSSMESDAKRVAELQCRAKALTEKAGAGDMAAMSEAMRITSEAVSLHAELEARYASAEEQKQFGEVLLKEMGKCN